MAYFQLELGGITARFDRFFGSSFPRIGAGTDNGVTYTASGVAVQSGTLYEAKHLWTIDAFCTRVNRDALKAIWAESEYQRRILGLPEILVSDGIEPFTERSPRSRALAAGAVVITSGNYLSYFAQFKAVLTMMPEFRPLARDYGVIFTLQETSKTSP